MLSIKNLSPSLLSQKFKRYKLLKRFKGKGLQLGLKITIENTNVGSGVYIGNSCYISNSFIGNYSYVNSNSRIRNAVIGKFCSIGSGVKIELGSHPVDFVSTHPVFYANNKPFKTFATHTYFQEYKKVIIGNDIWIGEDALIMGGVTIGDGAIIAAGSIVTKNVEPYAIVGGVPAKIIRYRFDEKVRAIIQKSQWWDKDHQWLQTNHLLFHGVDKFINHFENDL
jgi:acetyltransferase-like isoleucine patch superfamily enzyme